ncbi:hypothetical protein STENM327S_08150 [Streptomyces tendae]
MHVQVVASPARPARPERRRSSAQLLPVACQPPLTFLPPRPALGRDGGSPSGSDWTQDCTYDGPYREAVVRSPITLKALTYAPSGGIVAAPTTSLPEEIGGDRNWDYRFTWLRDASTTLSALLGTGYRAGGTAHGGDGCCALSPATRKTCRSCTGSPASVTCGEAELAWLPGYEGSTPVRVGNGAADQLQLDVYGEVTETLHVRAP